MAIILKKYEFEGGLVAEIKEENEQIVVSVTDDHGGSLEVTGLSKHQRRKNFRLVRRF